MSEWAAKRFWKTADVAEVDGGFTVQLDTRPVRTPAKSPLVVPTKALARNIAMEWDAQGEKVDPMSMPFTRSSNAAIDKVSVQHGEVADLLAAYGDSDLLCYRASYPDGLVQRQNKAWDQLVDWSATALKAPLQVYVGIMHDSQPEASISHLTKQVHALTPFQLTAFHDLVSLSGSLIIAFAVIHDFAPADALWDTSRIDEDWQIEQWGEDEEATRQAQTKREAFLHADAFFRVSA